MIADFSISMGEDIWRWERVSLELCHPAQRLKTAYLVTIAMGSRLRKTILHRPNARDQISSSSPSPTIHWLHCTQPGLDMQMSLRGTWESWGPYLPAYPFCFPNQSTVFQPGSLESLSHFFPEDTIWVYRDIVPTVASGRGSFLGLLFSWVAGSWE